MRASNATREFATIILLASVVTLSCGRQSAVTQPMPRVSTAALVVRMLEQQQESLRDSIVRLTLAQVGTPYEYGGATPDSGFDCSGLVRYVFSRLHNEPPRAAAKQALIGTAVRRDQLRPGDLLTFGIGDSVTHIGIYVGQRKYVHASSVAGRVIVSPMDRPPSPLIRPLKGARRIVATYEPIERRRSGI